MAKKKAAKKKATRAFRPPMTATARKARLQARLNAEVEDARIADEKKRKTVLAEIKGLVREVLAEQSERVTGFAEYRGPIDPPALDVFTHKRAISENGPSPTSNVAAHTDELLAEIARLDDLATRLVNRLEPVMASNSTGIGGVPTSAPRPPVACGVSERIDTAAHRVSGITRVLEDAYTRLQV